jgi:hypothetical protein
MSRNALLRGVQKAHRFISYPRVAQAAAYGDAVSLWRGDHSAFRCLDEAVTWLCRAQDCSLSRDGGVARHYSLINGWSTSYPETTGYIVPTMLDIAKRWNRPDLQDRAQRMLDWLVSIQLPCGGFQGGLVDSKPVLPVTFNTGQILLGLAAGAAEFGQPYHDAMCRAADWLVETQDADGCWRKYPTPFAAPGEKCYETHVAWGLLEAATITRNERYSNAALANVRWALGSECSNGWFDKCCLENPSRPLTHTLGYALRGILEAYRFSRDETLLRAGRMTADGLRSALHPNGFLPGRLDHNWSGAVRWACLTGTAQVAHCWLLLIQETHDRHYQDAAAKALAYVRRTIDIRTSKPWRGGVKGSFPIYGGYGTYQYLNWAAKFFIDAQLLELDRRR